MDRKYIDWWVGVFVLVGLAALVALALKSGNMAPFWHDGYVLKTNFESVGGLKVRAPVKIGGVEVGRVRRIVVNPESYLIDVELSLNKDIKIPSDTSASIFTSGLLGEQYIALEPGGSGEKLKDGSSILLTQSAVSLEEIIGQFLYSKATEDPLLPGQELP